MEDPAGPFGGLVYRGGAKQSAFMIPLRDLKTSVEYMRQRSKSLEQLDPEAQAQLIIRYWQAVKEWIPEAWTEPRKHIALRSTGFWALAFIGSDVIDRAVGAGRISKADMLEALKSGRDWDWSNSGEFRGYGGRSGAVEIANQVVKEFAADGSSLSDIERELLKKAPDGD